VGFKLILLRAQAFPGCSSPSMLRFVAFLLLFASVGCISPAADVIRAAKASVPMKSAEPLEPLAWYQKVYQLIDASPNRKPPVRTFCQAGTENSQSALTALLLAIFLGWCGAPRFYYGYYGTAVIHLMMLFAPCIVLMFSCCAGAFSQFSELSQGFRRTASSPEEADAADAARTGPSETLDENEEDVEAKNPLKLGVSICCAVCCSTVWIVAAAVWSVVDVVLVANYHLFPQHGHCLVKI